MADWNIVGEEEICTFLFISSVTYSMDQRYEKLCHVFDICDRILNRRQHT